MKQQTTYKPCLLSDWGESANAKLSKQMQAKYEEGQPNNII